MFCSLYPVIFFSFPCPQCSNSSSTLPRFFGSLETGPRGSQIVPQPASWQPGTTGNGRRRLRRRRLQHSQNIFYFFFFRENWTNRLQRRCNSVRTSRHQLTPERPWKQGQGGPKSSPNQHLGNRGPPGMVVIAFVVAVSNTLNKSSIFYF